jgi:hypothetical protein
MILKSLNIKLVLVFSLSIILYFPSVYAQSGPGGVGSSSSNIIWLKADEITGLLNGDQVTTWADNSGNGNDITQPSSGLRPYYITGQVNGMPVIRFNGVNDRLRRTGFTSFPTTAITAYLIHKNNGESNDATISYASSGNNNDFLFFNSSNVAIYRANQNRSTGTSINDNSWHIIGGSWRSSNGNTRFYMDGVQTYSTSFQTGTSITSNGCLAIAAEQDAIDGGYDNSQDNNGDYAELIVYNTFLNQAQRIILENYLSSKYNLSISASGNDYFVYDAIHGHDVSGIGRESASDTHTDAQSAGILEFSNPSLLDANKEYLLFGHDNASIAGWTSSESPNSEIQRLSREWRCNETGDLGTITITIDTTLLPARTNSNLKFVLLVDSDGDFTSGASVYEMCSPLSDEFYEVTGIDISDGQYFSIGVIDPVFEFVNNDSYHFETDVNFGTSISVQTNYIACANVNVNFNVSSNTATNPADYILSSGTATVSAGSNTGTINFTVVGDLTAENTEDFSVSLLDGGGFPYDTHTLTIYDNDNTPKIQFNSSTSSHSEAAGAVSITIIRTGDNSVVSSCNYRLRIVGGSGTATQGDDYTFSSGTVTFNIGENTKTVPLNILEDVIYENNETVIIELYNVSAGTDFVPGGTEHTATINDNDTPPEIQFSIITDSDNENVSPVNIQVELSTLSQVDAEADYEVTGGSATGSGTDYTLANGTITISAGDITNNIVFTVTDDALQELSETIEVRLRNPIDVSLGDDSIYTYTIEDNDLFGYEGPAGVGDGTNNVLWLQADKITGLSDGNDITLWEDNSGNSNDIAQSNTLYTPRYYSNVVNSQPVVRFEQADNRFRKTNFSNFPTNEITVFYVNYTSDNGDGVLSYASSANDNEFLIFNNSNLSVYRGTNGNRSTGLSGSGSTWRIMTATWNTSNGNTQFYRNGNLDYNTNNFGTGSSITQGGCLAIGGEQDAVDGGYAAGQSHQGDIPEVMIYNSVVNSAQRIIIENYLSSKYGIAIITDLFSYDANYGNELTGIGRVDANNFHIDAKGPAIVRINNPSDLGNGEYMLWGHDNANTVTPNTTDVPVGIDNRLNRIWRVDETGDVGTIRIYFDLSAYEIDDPDSLVLLIDSDDGSFVNASIHNSGLTFNTTDTTVYFTDVNFNSGDWFTVASKTSTNPLPVELLYFDAEHENHIVNLSWETLSEINNDYFIVERSDESFIFSPIEKINGAGNTNQLQKYKTIDTEPLKNTSYYRLKQIDFDGKYSYSNIVSVYINEEAEDLMIHIYPNPNRNRLFYINYTNPSKAKEMFFAVYDLYGNCLEKISYKTSENLIFEYGHSLDKGVYLIHITDGISKDVKQIVIQ